MNWWNTPIKGATPEWAWCPNSGNEQNFYFQSQSQNQFYEHDSSGLRNFQNPMLRSNNERLDSNFSYMQNFNQESTFSNFNCFESAPNVYPPYENHPTLDGFISSSEEWVNCEKFSPSFLEKCTSFVETLARKNELQDALIKSKDEEIQRLEHSMAMMQKALQEEKEAAAKGSGKISIPFFYTNPLLDDAEPIEQEEEEEIPQAPSHQIHEESVVEVIEANEKILTLGDIWEDESYAQEVEYLEEKFYETFVQVHEEINGQRDDPKELTVTPKLEAAETVKKSIASFDFHLMLAEFLGGARFGIPKSKFPCWTLKEKIFPRTVEEKFFKIFPYYPP